MGHDLTLLRAQVRVAAVSLFVGFLAMAAADPFVSRTAYRQLWALKLPVFLGCVMLWRFAARARSAEALFRSVAALGLLAIAITTPSTILVAVGWHSLTFMSIYALSTAGLMPWGLRMQTCFVAAMVPFALVPLFVVGGGETAPFPIATAVFSIAVSMIFAQRNERHHVEMQQRLDLLHENLERLRQLTEHIHGVFWLNELDGTLLYVSPRYEEIWGRRCGDLERQPEGWLDAVHADDRPVVRAWARRAAGRGAAACEYRLIRPDGGLRRIRDARFPISGAGGELWRIARLSLDVSAEHEAARARSMQELARSIQAAVEDERKRLARELHDELGQVLTGIKLQLTGMERPLGAIEVDAGTSIRGCIREVEHATQAVHAMIHMLRPPALDDLGLVAALRLQADDFARHTGIPCTLDVPDEEPSLSDEQVSTVFRIAQESLTNVARHAQASHVALHFGVHGDRLQLCVEDDGKGIASAPEDFGLRGMRERAALLNGSLDVEPRRDGGTLVRLELPRRAAPAPFSRAVGGDPRCGNV
jgi:PAS domain S-box-containing protein